MNPTQSADLVRGCETCGNGPIPESETLCLCCKHGHRWFEQAEDDRWRCAGVYCKRCLVRHADRTTGAGSSLNQSMDDLTAYKEFVLDIEAEVEAAAHHCQQATDENYELRITLLGLRNCLARLEERLETTRCEPCPECGSKTAECLEFCDCGWCAEGVPRPALIDGHD